MSQLEGQLDDPLSHGSQGTGKALSILAQRSKTLIILWIVKVTLTYPPSCLMLIQHTCRVSRCGKSDKPTASPLLTSHLTLKSQECKLQKRSDIVL